MILGLLILIVVAGVAAHSYRHTSVLEAAHPPVGAFVDAGAERIHYLEKGQGSPLILIHGANANLRDFTHRGLIDRLAKDWRVIAFDRPGAGYSSRNGPEMGDPRNQATALRLAAERLGVSAPVVVGHSWGGAVALAWALQDPGLTGVVTLGGVASDPPGRPDGLYRLVATPVVGAVATALAPIVFPADYVSTRIGRVFAPDAAQDGYAEALAADLAMRYGQARSTARDVVTLYTVMKEISAGYPRLRPPLEVISGDQDRSVPHQIHSVPLSEAAPNARLTIIEGAGHMPHHVHRDVFLAALDRLRPSAP